MRTSPNKTIYPCRAQIFGARSRVWRDIVALAALGMALSLTAFAATARAAATIEVSTTAQTVNGSDGFCSLPEAIYAANFDSNTAIDQSDPQQLVTTECTPGSGDDTIVLPAGAAFPMSGIISEGHNYLGPTATPLVYSNIIIEANGARLEHIPNGIDFRAFAVGSDIGAGSLTGHLTIRNAHIKGFTVKGGDGAGGGGGGLGAGGAIYVHGGGLVVESSTFEANGAAGGNGSSIDFDTGGGGGGLSGDGGSGLIHECGGGGGGARGDGADGYLSTPSICVGGGGGGTVSDGVLSDGGFDCGGDGASVNDRPFGNDGHVGVCRGGGGGGGQKFDPIVIFLGEGDGGPGTYGGGGGGGGAQRGSGGHGGFGGGGGAATAVADFFGPNGGDGGFGGGGGASTDGEIAGGGPGSGGSFAGDASREHGGGGAGLGGAIFGHSATIEIHNSTFSGNFAVRGLEGGPGAGRGHGIGGAIVTVAGSLTVLNSTISANESTSNIGTAVLVYKPTTGDATTFALRNTIIANSLPGKDECVVFNGAAATGTNNLIVPHATNEFSACPGVTQTGDPQLGPLQLNAPGVTPTMAIPLTSPAVDTADPATALATDQRGVARPLNNGFDIGAFEAPPADVTAPTVTINQAAGQADPTSTSPINFTAVFNEPVTGFASGEVTLSGTAGATTSAVTEIAPNDGTSYNVAVSGMTGSGTVIASIPAGVATDAASNGNEASTSTDNTVTFDVTPPSVTINQAAGQADPTSTSPINFTAVFSEPVSGFATGDVTLSGTAGATTATVSQIAPSDGTTYNVAVSGMAGFGTVTATIAAGVATDAVGNANTASTSTDNTVTFAPTCNGQFATIYVNAQGRIVGAPDNGKLYAGKLRGTSGADVIVGTAGRDDIDAKAGNDTVCGGGGNDVLEGAGGNDRLLGEDGNDTLQGGGGNDTMTGGFGADKFMGGAGRDTATDFTPAQGDTKTGVEVP